MGVRAQWYGAAADVLPVNPAVATLIGRAWIPAYHGPVPVVVRDGQVFEIRDFDTVRDITERADAVDVVRRNRGRHWGGVGELLTNTPVDLRNPERPWLLSPVDLHVVKAAGVTFAASLLERVIEERALGDPGSAVTVRQEIEAVLGSQISRVVPGSAKAAELREILTTRGLWSQYLEVGIGPDAEVFTKAPILATVGTATDVGIRDDSAWNNPEPEIVLVVSSGGGIVGACLGNDVNHRDLEGRSALLLGQAKDSTASAAIGPFIRLFDGDFTLDDVRSTTVDVRIDGTDGFALIESSEMSLISRDPTDLVAQACGRRHQYPDGFCLFLGTMFAPTADRGEPGRGFTHYSGDIVSISAPDLGMLVNRVRTTPDLEPWSFGVADLFASIIRRRGHEE